MQGYMRMAVEKIRRSVQPVYTFNTINEGQFMLRSLVEEFGLCSRMCNVTTAPDCDCTIDHSDPVVYNQKAEAAIARVKAQLPTFALIDKGIDDNEHSCILVRNGNLYGMGYLSDKQEQLKSVDALLASIVPMQDNDYIRNLVLRHATDYPEKCVIF
jgi:DNA polymerase-3 subunit epsilon